MTNDSIEETDPYYKGYSDAMTDLIKQREEISQLEKSLSSITLYFDKYWKKLNEIEDDNADKRIIPYALGIKQFEKMLFNDAKNNNGKQIKAYLSAILMAMDFQYILDEIKKNPICESQWNKLLMSLKLTQNKKYD